MTRLLHISHNQINGIDPNDATTKIWIELSKSFDKYFVLARSPDNRFRTYRFEKITLHTIPKITNRSLWFIFTSIYLLYYCTKIKPSLILCQSPLFGGPFSIIAKWLYKIPVMIEIHGYDYFSWYKKRGFLVYLLKGIVTFSLKNASKVRALNEKMVNDLLEIGIRNRIVVILNRVNLEVFNKVKEDYRIDQKNIKLISVGTFVERKGYEKLITLLKKHNFSCSLTLVGGGPLRSKYENLSSSSCVNLTLIDRLPQTKLIDLLVSADIYIQTSERFGEGMPRTILEAMALRLPILTTDAGATSETITNRVNGMLLNSARFDEEFIPALRAIVDSEHLRESLGKQAYRDILEKYEWNKVFDTYRFELVSLL